MSQAVIESRTGIRRCYISRLENGRSVPALETLEKLAPAFDLPLYQLFYDGNKTPLVPKSVRGDDGWGAKGKDARTFNRFRRLLRRTNARDRELLMSVGNQDGTNAKQKN